MRFASLVARCILAVHKITGTENVDSVNAIVDRAIDKRIMHQMKDIAAIVSSAIDAMGEEERSVLIEATRKWEAEREGRDDAGATSE